MKVQNLLVPQNSHPTGSYHPILAIRVVIFTAPTLNIATKKLPEGVIWKDIIYIIMTVMRD